MLLLSLPIKFIRMFKLLSITSIILLATSCARVGRPTGGEKDTTPPKVIFTKPAQQSVRFKGNEIILQFNELVTIKDIQKNLLISPPPEQMPLIIPNGIASKTFTLKFQNGLQAQTTYSINFGESIADYNENNPLKNFQLIFSTGDQIDSLQFKGKAVSLYQTEKPKKIIIGLYPESNFNDSLVFKEKPYYVTVAGKNGDFKFTHLKQGIYRLLAIGDENNDYKYKQGKEWIGFLPNKINIPADSTATVYLFQEPMRPSIDKITQLSSNHIQIAFKGNADSLKIKALSPVSKELIIKKTKIYEYWYKSSQDSIRLLIQLNSKTKKFRKKRNSVKDSLVISLPKNLRLNPLDTLLIKSNMPLSDFDSGKILLLKDSLPVKFKPVFNIRKDLYILFDKNPGENYQFTLLPGSLTGFSGEKLRDTIHTKIAIPPPESFGNLYVKLLNTGKTPKFIELLRNKKIVRKTTSSTKDVFEFKYLKPDQYTLRIIFDRNNNNRWDSGDYLHHIQAEKTFEPKKKIEIRANWDVNQQYDLKK